MENDASRTCIKWQGSMASIIVKDKLHPGLTIHWYAGSLEYRLPEDRHNSWTGKFPTAGTVRAFMREECGRITLYGETSGAEQHTDE